MKYQILNKLNESVYEDFGTLKSKQDAEDRRKLINVIYGYSLDNIMILEVEQ